MKRRGLAHNGNMQDLITELASRITRMQPQEGGQTTPVVGVHLVKYSQTDEPSRRRWRACLALVAQGRKAIQLGETHYDGGPGNYTVSPLVLPVLSRVAEASPRKPFLGLLIDLDPRILGEVAAHVPFEPQPAQASQQAVFLGKADEAMLQTALRLVALFETPEDAPMLGPLIVKELIYRVLKGPDGQAIRQFVSAGSKLHKIYQAVFRLESELSRDIDVESLAREVNMSRSAFFQTFQEVTSLSPIQYQKRLRLLEARRLMLEEAESAERSAFRVGYKSPSQFSREYARMFGAPPLRDALSLRDAGTSRQQVEVSGY